MADIPLSSLVGGGGIVLMAPDLNYPSTLNAGSFKQVTVNPAGSLVTALSLTGKWQLFMLELNGLTAESLTVKLTVDSVVVWNDTFTSSTVLRLIGAITGTTQNPSEPIYCNNSLLLELQTATDTAVQVNYNARPIL